jgi:hypothetical protein
MLTQQLVIANRPTGCVESRLNSILYLIEAKRVEEAMSMSKSVLSTLRSSTVQVGDVQKETIGLLGKLIMKWLYLNGTKDRTHSISSVLSDAADGLRIILTKIDGEKTEEEVLVAHMYSYLGVLLTQSGSHSKAVIAIENSWSVSRSPSPGRYRQSGYVLLKAGRFEEGNAFLKLAAQTDPRDPVCRYNMGVSRYVKICIYIMDCANICSFVCSYYLEAPDEAMIHFRVAASLEPTNDQYLSAITFLESEGRSKSSRLDILLHDDDINAGNSFVFASPFPILCSVNILTPGYLTKLK